MENTQMTPLNAVLNPPIEIQDNDSQPSYQRTYSETSPRPIVLLRQRPIIKAQKTPREIIGHNEDIIKKTLIGWGKAREFTTWKEFAAKLSPDISGILAETFMELRRHGFFNPRVRDDKIIVDYICYPRGDMESKALDLCTLCERECSRKDWRGVFKQDKSGNEARKCWD